ncbi:MAG: hypothetical protein KKC79_21105 [Gammaproteobacteria bacterium]|nr:hypothetical protein [Gammaproteobacteria bacterium]MBU1440231.1 hypothetical protein [Gammaproteobacteria bacterium]MBU2288047.1 hypothetical protein [Gammaproteobacteria bacterium]MBU2411137.1 hypothetical protein [Gammaproteobacteria bacterium]
MHTDIAPLLEAHRGLWHRARFVAMRFDVAAGDERVRVHVDDQQVRVEPLPSGTSEPSDFVLAGSAEAWAEYARDLPRPGYQDILAMLESNHASFDGDGLCFFRNLFLVKGIVATLFRGDPRW